MDDVVLKRGRFSSDGCRRLRLPWSIGFCSTASTRIAHFYKQRLIAAIVGGSWDLNLSRFPCAFSSITCGSDMEGCSSWASTKADSLTKCFIQIQLIPSGPWAFTRHPAICANISIMLPPSTRLSCRTTTGVCGTGLDMSSCHPALLP